VEKLKSQISNRNTGPQVFPLPWFVGAHASPKLTPLVPAIVIVRPTSALDVNVCGFDVSKASLQPLSRCCLIKSLAYYITVSKNETIESPIVLSCRHGTLCFCIKKLL
jgi:hypothetical protein